MATKDDLIKLCIQMLAQDGMSAFSLRKLAERVGIKAPSIYEHFENKEALFTAVRSYASSALAQALDSSSGQGDVRQKLIATAMGYLQFAATQPHLFTLLMSQTTSSRTHLDEAPEPDSPYVVLLTQVKSVLGPENASAETVCFGLWSLVHGAAMLRQSHLQKYAASIPDLTTRNVEALLNGWSTQ
jgi:AcrR family transcriptional regulator